MKQDFLRKWSNWWILSPHAAKLNDAFEKELNDLMAHKVDREKLIELITQHIHTRRIYAEKLADEILMILK